MRAFARVRIGFKITGEIMKYIDIINKCLTELNYKKVRYFDELVKNDHQKLKNILNIINSEVCTFDNWNFLLRRTQLTLPAKIGEIENTINGKIHTLTIDDKKYEYSEDLEMFLLNKNNPDKYGSLNDQLLFPVFDTEKKVDIVYYTNNFVKDANGYAKTAFTAEDDETVIPEPFAEPLLTYGACMRMKANPQYTKFNYWYGMYKDNLATMRSKLCANASQTPTIKLSRG
jgi:hypothetical protein